MLRKTIFSAIAFSLAAGTAAFAQDANDRDRGFDRGNGPRGWMLERLDADGNGTISADEFGGRRLEMLQAADEDGDGALTQEEIADYLMRREFMRKAERAARRLDIDGDGTVTLEEIEDHQGKRFALMDRDNDGEVSREEMRRSAAGWRAMHMHRMGDDGPRFGRHGAKDRPHHRKMRRMHRAERLAPATPADEAPATETQSDE